MSKGRPNVAFFNGGEGDAMKLAHRWMYYMALSALRKMQKTNAVLGFDQEISAKKVGSFARRLRMVVWQAS